MKFAIKKTLIVLPVILVALGVGVFSKCAAAPKAAAMETGRDIHYSTITVDTHNDSLLNTVYQESWPPRVDIGISSARHQLDLVKMREGGLDVAFFGAFSEDHEREDLSNSVILRLLNALYWLEERNKDSFGITRAPEEMMALYKAGKLAGVPAIEGAYSLKSHNALELLRQYNDLKVAYITLCWHYSNALGEGVYAYYRDKKPSSGGLTPLGAEVVREMNRLGIAVDVSHMNDATFWGVVEASNAPIIASHSNAWGVFQHMRNLKDDQLIAIAKSGGVVHQNFYSGYLGPPGQQELKNMVDMIDYTVKLIGIDHVGLGSDFDGGSMPFDLPNAAYYYKITEELVSRGYSRGDIEKILGKNTLRVFQAIQDLAEAPVTGGEPLVIKADANPVDINLAGAVMGGILKTRTPLLQARIQGNQIDASRFRIIVDGIVYDPEYYAGTGILSVTLEKPLREKFHIVTFEGANTSGQVTRETKIFFIED